MSIGSCITSWLQLNWLMSWTWAAGPALDLFREVRWWFAPGGCPFAPLILGAIVVSFCSFWCGVLITCCILSARCRHWVWHCAVGIQHFWGDRGHLPEALVARERFREYRRAWACAVSANPRFADLCAVCGIGSTECVEVNAQQLLSVVLGLRRLVPLQLLFPLNYFLGWLWLSFPLISSTSSWLPKPLQPWTGCFQCSWSPTCRSPFCRALILFGPLEFEPSVPFEQAFLLDGFGWGNFQSKRLLWPFLLTINSTWCWGLEDSPHLSSPLPTRSTLAWFLRVRILWVGASLTGFLF